MNTIHLHESGIVVDGTQVGIPSKQAVARLCELAGPRYERRPIGVSGSGRIGHWLKSGLIVVSQVEDTEVVSVHVCFEADSGPYSRIGCAVEPFVGQVTFLGLEVRGGESESYVCGFPGVRGFGGIMSLKEGQLFVGLELRKRVNRFGKRVGRRSLVSVSAEWGGVRPFPPRDSVSK